MRQKALLTLGIAAGLLLPSVAWGDVTIGIQVGPPAPPPRLVVASPPQLVVVPGTTVYHVPGASFNLFVHGGRYYSFHDGAWFHAGTHNGPWKVIAVKHVPQPVRAVPVTYYKIPPGQAKKMGLGEPKGHAKGPHGKGPKLKKDRDD